MAVVRRIVDDYKGKIEIFSELNEGTEVVIELPIGESETYSQLILGDYTQKVSKRKKVYRHQPM